MEHLFNETIHIERTYVMYQGEEYLREYDFVDNKLSWIKDPAEEIGPAEKITNYNELESIYQNMWK